MKESPLLLVEHVRKTYPVGNSVPPLTVLADISLTVQQGESLAITGPSGSGKSTLLNIIGTLDQPSAGTVTLNGRKVSSLSEQEAARVRNKDIGFVFQLHYLLPQCTVLENVLMPTLPGNQTQSAEHLHNRARGLLERVGLAQRLYHRPGQLSGGECQRVAVVRALITKPLLLLADEPTGALDHTSAEQLINLLVELNCEEGVTLIVVTHAEELAGRMQQQYLLRDGILHHQQQ